MARALGVGVPAGGLVAGVAALALWVSALSLRWLDGLVAALFVAGLGAGGRRATLRGGRRAHAPARRRRARLERVRPGDAGWSLYAAG